MWDSCHKYVDGVTFGLRRPLWVSYFEFDTRPNNEHWPNEIPHLLAQDWARARPRQDSATHY